MALADTQRLIASLELQDKFSRTANKFDSTLTGMERRTSSAFGKIGTDVSRGIGRLSTNLLAIGTIASGIAVGGIIASVRAASDLNEEIDKAKVVFGEASDEVIDFSKNAATIGLATSEALGAAGAFGNMFNTIGIAEEESADMSTTMVQLAADMASFNNEDPSEMLDRLRSGLAGEAEPLRRFGVLLSEVTVKEFAYRTGIAETGEALTEAQKVQARYGLILENTAIQQGNFALTSKSLANQQRQLRSNLKNTAAVIGQAFLPSLSKVGIAINELFLEKQPQIIAFSERLGESLEDLFTDANIQSGMDRIGGFVDRLAEGDVSGAFGDIRTVLSSLASLPWGAIGDAARILGTGSKALLDAFLGMPPWVQTAVLTGWGLNKLTGGALGSIVSTLASGLIKGVLGINAGVVNVNAGTVTGGGGVPGTAGGGAGSLVTPLLRTGIAATIGAAIGVAAGSELHEAIVAESRGFEQTAFGGRTRDLEATEHNLELIRGTLGDLEMDTGAGLNHLASMVTGTDSVITTLQNQEEILEDELTQLRVQEHSQRENTSLIREGNRELVTSARILAQQKETAARGFAEQARLGQSSVAQLSRIEQKNFSPTVRVGVTSNVSITDITRRLVTQRISIGGTGGITM